MASAWETAAAAANRVTTSTFGVSATIAGNTVEHVIPLGRWRDTLDPEGVRLSGMEYRLQVRHVDLTVDPVAGDAVTISGDTRSFEVQEWQRGTDGMDVLTLYEVA